jgi:hypothetical protein
MTRLTTVFLTDAAGDRYAAPRGARDELLRRIAFLRTRMWSDHDEAEDLREQLAEAERQLRALDDAGRGGP